MYNLSLGPSLKLEVVSHTFLHPRWGQTTFFAPFWRLYHNDRPGATVSLGGRNWRMTPERLYLIPPATGFSGEVEDGQVVGHLFIHFRAGRPYDQTRPLILDWAATPTDLTATARLRQALTASQPLAPEAQMAALYLVSHGLCRVPAADLGQGALEPRVQAAIQQAMARPREALDVGALAAGVGLSRPAFTRLFRRVTGETPHRYLLSLKLEQARYQLELTDRSLEQIAADLGFSDRFHLTRHFARHYGRAPAAHRRTFRGLNRN